MGSENSKDLSPSQMNDLKSCTTFSGREIRDLYKKFHQDCPSGAMPKESFMQMYNQLFPNGNAELFAEHVFNAYDIDGNGSIDFREFMCTVNVASRGSIDEKLRWAFNMYDLDGNGSVSKTEVHEILKAIYKMKGNVGIPPECGITNPEEAVEKLFAALDKNRDDTLSDVEFVIGAKSAPEIMGILQATHTVHSD